MLHTKMVTTTFQPFYKNAMDHIKFLVKVNNVVGYILIISIVLSPIGFIQVLLGYLVLIALDKKGVSEKENLFKSIQYQNGDFRD